MLDLLFTDFDGCLHPHGCAESRFFESAPVLIRLLEPFPHVSLVLSTSWVWDIGFERARDHLPEPLRSRVIGATQQSSWHRTVQITADVERRKPRAWLAIDDSAPHWPPRFKRRLVKTPKDLGLACQDTQRVLGERLREFFTLSK
jgi:hypothetical protein